MRALTTELKKILQENGLGSYLREIVTNSMTNIPVCKYYNEDTIEQLLKNTKTALTILNLNIRSLDKNLSDLMVLLQTINHDFDIICLSEIGIKNVESRCNIMRPRYNIEFVKPERKKCRGVCIMIRSDLRY